MYGIDMGEFEELNLKNVWNWFGRIKSWKCMELIGRIGRVKS